MFPVPREARYSVARRRGKLFGLWGASVKFSVYYASPKTGKRVKYSARRKLVAVVRYGAYVWTFEPSFSARITKEVFLEWLALQRKKERRRRARAKAKAEAAKRKKEAEEAEDFEDAEGIEAPVKPRVGKLTARTPESEWVPVELEERSFEQQVARFSQTVEGDPIVYNKQTAGLEVIDLSDRFMAPDPTAKTPEAFGGKYWRVIRIWTLAYNPTTRKYTRFSYAREIKRTTSWEKLLQEVAALESERIAAAEKAEYITDWGVFAWTAYAGG